MKEVRALEWLKRISDALEYMEKSMEEPFDAAEIARVACSSTFHFQRMFHMLTGITVAEYVRKRKLTLAAQELAVTKAKVLDIALKYGYDTPESFSKAFRKAHGISPSVAREPGTNLKAYPRISFHLSLKGDQDMDYRIIEREAFQVVGKAKTISTKDGVNFKQVPEFWQEYLRDKTEDRLAPYCKTGTCLGICLDMDMKQEQLVYMIAVESDRASESAEFVTRTIPASTWAVFTSVGPVPTAIQHVWDRVWQEWFPATGYEHAGTAELEVYLPGDATAADYRAEVWIPIIRK
jgi:AraC family transcriptional regulator